MQGGKKRPISIFVTLQKVIKIRKQNFMRLKEEQHSNRTSVSLLTRFQSNTADLKI